MGSSKQGLQPRLAGVLYGDFWGNVGPYPLPHNGNPATINNAHADSALIAQLAERVLGKNEVSSSNLDEGSRARRFPITRVAVKPLPARRTRNGEGAI